MPYKYRRTPKEMTEAEALFLELWNRDTEQSLDTISKRARIGTARAKVIVERAISSGLTVRQPRQESTRASRTGRL